VKQTPFGIFIPIEGAKVLTSSARRFLSRSVTTYMLDLRVPTKTAPTFGPTAMWRASGTMA
jgi:hypothetical protein